MVNCRLDTSGLKKRIGFMIGFYPLLLIPFFLRLETNSIDDTSRDCRN